MSRVLIVEDDVDAARAMGMAVSQAGFPVTEAHSLQAARACLTRMKPELVLLDLQLPDGTGLSLLDEAGDAIANAQVVLITGHATLETSISAMRAGVADYLLKPVSLKQLEAILSRVVAPSALQAELAQMQDEWSRSGRFGLLWGRSDAMRRVHDQIVRVAATAVTVLITGESGTGKELVARSVHDMSRRRQAPFLAVNCGAISPHLIESEIFGHEKGSFTGADRQHLGFFERAHGGTLFLDEITEMPLDLQVKLLRVLETGSFMRVGSTVRQDADVRVIAATNRAPLQAVANGRLREDLFYRLNVFPIALPPLRERSGDVALLAEHFLNEISRREGQVKHFAPETLARLTAHKWPGNVRELRNVVQRAYVMSEGTDIRDDWVQTAEPAARTSTPQAAAPTLASTLSQGRVYTVGDELRVKVGCSIADVERQLILATMQHFQNNRERAAAVLGVSMKTLYNRLKEYGADTSGRGSPLDV